MGEFFFYCRLLVWLFFVAYEGFELIANAAEDIKNPKSNLPKAFYGSILLVILLYILIAVITTCTVPESQLLLAKDYALAIAAKPALGQWGFSIVAITAILATFSAVNATIYGNSRLGYILAKEGELPEILSKEKRNIPMVDIMFTAFLSLIIANSINLTEIAIIGSASFLLIFFIVNICAYKMHNKIGARKYITLAACIASNAALVMLLIHTSSNNPQAIGIFLSFIGISVLFELVYGRIVRKHIFQRPYKNAQSGKGE